MIVKCSLGDCLIWKNAWFDCRGTWGFSWILLVLENKRSGHGEQSACDLGYLWNCICVNHSLETTFDNLDNGTGNDDENEDRRG